jgi:manganese efflux pump family protein
VVAVGTALIAALVTACAAGTAGPGATARVASAIGPATADQAASSAPPASTESCYAFAVSALTSHVVVRRRPPACAGLPQAVVNQDVARAIRTVIGPLPKAKARSLAAADSRYLAGLVRTVRPPRAASVAAGPTTTSGDLALRFSALAAWLAAALAGAYLLWGLVKRGRPWRPFGKPGAPPLVPVIHACVAITGLLIWIAFTVTTVAALAWADVGLTWVIAGLGMAALLSGPDQQSGTGTDSTAPGEQAGASRASFPSRAPVIVIALHGVLATLTILLVLLAAIAIG